MPGIRVELRVLDSQVRSTANDRMEAFAALTSDAIEPTWRQVKGTRAGFA